MMGQEKGVIMSQENDRQLPDGWQWVKLGDVCETTSGGTPSRNVASYYDGDIHWVKSGDLNDGYIQDTEELISELAIKNSSAKIFPSGTLLIAMYGATVGKLGILNIDAATNQAVCAIFTNDNLIRDYLFLYLLNKRQDLIEISFGGAQPNISQNIIRGIKIPLPPLSEQKRIAAILNEQMEAVEKARKATEAQLEAAKALPAAYLRAVFESEEANSWERKTLNEVCWDISDGSHFTPTYVSDGVPFLSVKDIRETRINFDDCRFITAEEHQQLCKRCKPEKGDVLYTKVGTTGIAKAIDIDKEFSIFVSVALLKVKSNILPEYLEKVLNSPLCKSQAEQLTQGAANRNLVIKDLKQIELNVPPIPRQKQIASTLTEQMQEVERLKQNLKEQLDTINKLPAVLLRRAFNGEL